MPGIKYDFLQMLE